MSDRSRTPLQRRGIHDENAKLKTENILLEAEVAHWKELAEKWKDSADGNWKGLVTLSEKTASQENTIAELKQKLEEERESAK